MSPRVPRSGSAKLERRKRVKHGVVVGEHELPISPGDSAYDPRLFDQHGSE